MSILRFRFAKQGIARFISHLDLMRCVERAVRRAGLPAALTEGFHPHYRISFGPALPLGVTSTAEYADLALGEPIEPHEFMLRLNSRLPGGIEVLDAGYVDSQGTLGEIIERASYVVALAADGVPAEVLIDSWKRILMAEEYFIEKESRGGTKKVDIRPGIAMSYWTPNDGETNLHLLLATGSRGNLRPEDAVRPLLGDKVRIDAIHRDGLYGLRHGMLVNPFGSVCAWPMVE